MDRRLNHDSLEIFFALGYVPGSETLIEGVKKLAAGQLLTYQIGAKTFETRWFGRRHMGSGSYGSSRIREVLGEAVRAHTMGLRPFGMYLSGGLDSTVVLHELEQGNKEKVRTYTTRFDVADSSYNYNEDADAAQRLCKDYRIDHHELLIKDDDFTDATEKAIQSIEEPRYSPSIGAYWLLAKEASKDVAVILSGSGGDELFLGYPKYQRSRIISRRLEILPHVAVDLVYSWRAWRRGRLSRGEVLRLEQSIDRWAFVNNINTRGNIGTLAQAIKDIGYPASKDPLGDNENAIAELDRLTWLADEEFLRTDKIAMQFGMEGRFPFMANEVVRMANSIPSREKLRHGATKHMLREAYRGHLPDYIVDKAKTGWKAPAAPWMQGRFGEFVRSTLSPEYYDAMSGVLDLPFAQAAVAGGPHTTVSIKRFMLAFTFQIWARHFKITT